MLNRVELIGCLLKKPTLRQLSTGQPVLNPVIVIEDRTGPRSPRIQTTIYGAAAAELDAVAEAGMPIYVEGRLIIEDRGGLDQMKVMIYRWSRLDAEGFARLRSKTDALMPG